MQINRLILSFFIPAIAWLAVAQSETDTMNSKFIIFSVLLTLGALTANSKEMNSINADTSMAPVEKTELTQQWDKVFPQSDKVEHSKVFFVNRYGITLAADMYKPKNAPENWRLLP